MLSRRMLSVVSLVAFAVPALSQAIARAEDAPQRWRLAMQVYTFHQETFFQALDNCKKLDIKYIEIFPGQALSPEQKDVKIHHDMSAEARSIVKKKLADYGMKLVAYGVVGLDNNEAEARKVFDFAKDMGIGVIVSEPKKDCFDLLDKLTEEYGICVAIHNHPKPSLYWNPDVVLDAVKGHSKRIGACADTGHWMRSGINPLEALKKLEGRIISSHFKDLNKMGAGHDVPWGTGKADAKTLLEEFKRQGFSGAFSIEYEHNWGKAMPEIAQCVEWFNKVTAELYGDK